MNAFYATVRALLLELSAGLVTVKSRRDNFEKETRDEWNTEGVNGYDDNIEGQIQRRDNFANQICNECNTEGVNGYDDNIKGENQQPK